jgi:hypothetical protein
MYIPGPGELLLCRAVSARDNNKNNGIVLKLKYSFISVAIKGLITSYGLL